MIELRIREMRNYAETKFPGGRRALSYRIVDCDVFYKKGADGKWESTANGYMQFGHRNARDAVMELFGCKQAALSVGGHSVNPLRQNGGRQSTRPSPLQRGSSDQEAQRRHGKTVEKMMSKDYYVKVDGDRLFSKAF